MQRSHWVVAIVSVLATAAAAQAPAAPGQGQATTSTQPQAASPPAAAPQTPAPLASISAIVDRQVSNYERLIMGVADAMPEEKYNFTPASLNIPGAAFSNVRTFAVLLKHTAAANYGFWGAVAGEAQPSNLKGPNGPEELKTKAEIVQFLRESFAVGHRAAKMLTPENALERVSFLNQSQPRLYFATNTVIHAADEYGQMVEYLRMNGIVPPASAGQR
jgi:hypothetical protein